MCCNETVNVKVIQSEFAVQLGMALPKYETAGAAGMDLTACIDADVWVEPGQRVLVPTGLHIQLPTGFEAQVRPRSGLAAKNGITVLNSPGTIDCDYTGEIKVILINLGTETFQILPGMRIAQMIVAPVSQAILVSVNSFVETERGDGGFGSSGV